MDSNFKSRQLLGTKCRKSLIELKLILSFNLLDVIISQINSKTENVSSVTTEVSAAKQRVLECENTIKQLNSDISVSVQNL